MADYFPPSENLPIFDVSVFRSTNDNVITQEEADRLYLSRLGTASSLATSTSFAGTVSCGGNLTLTAPLASNRQFEGSYLKLVDNASISTNKPIIWNPDPSLQITTNDVVGAVKTIDLKSFNGTGTGVSTSLSCQYGQVQAQGILKLTQNTNAASFSTITQDATNVTISTTDTVGATRAIILKTFDGLGTGQSAATSISYGQLFANGTIRLANLTNSARFSTFTMGSTELTIANNYTGATPHINLNTPTAGAGNIITNSPLHLTNKADPTKISTLTQGAADLTLSNTTAAGSIIINTEAAGAGNVITNSPLYLTNKADPTKISTLTQGAADLTLSNTTAAGNIIINTAAAGAGNVITNSPLQITNKADPTKTSTITQGALNLTIQNAVSTGNILLNTNAGAIVANRPIVPTDDAPILYLGRPSLGYTRSGSSTGIPITSTAPIIYQTSTDTVFGTWLFEASVTCVKGTSTFSTVAPLSSTRLSYLGGIGIAWNGDVSFENPLLDLYTTVNYCGCTGNSRVATITTPLAVQFQFQANWATISGSPTFSIFWSAVRIA